MTIDKVICLAIGFILGINATVIFIGVMISKGKEID